MSDEETGIDAYLAHHEDQDELETVMQPRCVHCKREQYALAVLPVSLGQAGCSWCGEVAPVFTDWQEYQSALRAPRKCEAGRRIRPTDESVQGFSEPCEQFAPSSVIISDVRDGRHVEGIVYLCNRHIELLKEQAPHRRLD